MEYCDCGIWRNVVSFASFRVLASFSQILNSDKVVFMFMHLKPYHEQLSFWKYFLCNYIKLYEPSHEKTCLRDF